MSTWRSGTATGSPWRSRRRERASSSNGPKTYFIGRIVPCPLQFEVKRDEVRCPKLPLLGEESLQRSLQYLRLQPQIADLPFFAPADNAGLYENRRVMAQERTTDAKAFRQARASPLFAIGQASDDAQADWICERAQNAHERLSLFVHRAIVPFIDEEITVKYIFDSLACLT